MEKVRRVLHPSDFSSASAAAFKAALEMAKTNDAELMLVHVLTPVAPIVGEGYVSPKTYEEIEQSARAHGQKQLDGLIDKAKKAGVRATGTLLQGMPHDQVVRAAKSKHADVIVMGTHGRSGIAKLFLGSVAERVVATAPCPVLTVRGK